MKKLALTIGLALIPFFSFAQTRNFIDQPYLETTARVDTLVSPDVIYLDIILQEKDERNKLSVEELETRMITELEALGIDTREQLTLSDLASNFKTYFLKPKDILKDKAYKLKVFDAQTAGKALVKLEAVGISNVNLDRTEYSRIEELKLQLRAKAVKKAKLQADHLVRPLGQKATSAIHITDRYYPAMNAFQADLNEVVVTGFSRKAQQEYQPPAIEFKPILVESEVNVKFKIE